jgi:hypothetical protein
MTPPILKNFDAVAESRKWREATSCKLDAMSLEERLAHFAQVRERYVARQKMLAQGKRLVAH